jgi:NADPH-dependent ferric siderophore reductase
MSIAERGVERVRHQPKYRLAEVVTTRPLTPRMQRIVFHSDDFADFRSAAYDDHIRLFLPQPGSDAPRPLRRENGLVFPPGVARPDARDYTPRAFDSAQNLLTVDFVLHGHGPGSSFATRAQPGDRIGVSGPGSSMVVRGDFDWYLLIGDETALPAIGRRIEELPRGARVLAFIEIADQRERQSFASAADVVLNWIERDRAGSDRSTLLLDAVRAAAIPAGTGFAFVAAENAAARALRRHLVEERGVDPDFIKAYRFWQRGEADLGQGG